MKINNRPRPAVRRRIRGVMLIEVMIGAVIFALGILALIGLQSIAIKDLNEAKFRTDASFLANRVVGDLWSTSPATIPALAGTYSATQNATHPWAIAATDTASGLPGGAITLTINTINDPAGLIHEVVVTVGWQAPGGDPHSYSQRAVISDA